MLEKKLSVCRSGYKNTKDFVYQFLHNVAQKYSNIPSCPVPAGKYYVRNFAFDSNLFFGVAGESDKTFMYLGDYCFKNKIAGVDPCFVRSTVKLRLQK